MAMVASSPIRRSTSERGAAVRTPAILAAAAVRVRDVDGDAGERVMVGMPFGADCA